MGPVLFKGDFSMRMEFHLTFLLLSSIISFAASSEEDLNSPLIIGSSCVLEAIDPSNGNFDQEASDACGKCFEGAGSDISEFRLVIHMMIMVVFENARMSMIRPKALNSCYCYIHLQLTINHQVLKQELFWEVFDRHVFHLCYSSCQWWWYQANQPFYKSITITKIMLVFPLSR